MCPSHPPSILSLTRLVPCLDRARCRPPAIALPSPVAMLSRALARRAREPEARGTHRAEHDGDEEGQAVAAGEVMDRPAKPRRDAAADAVAHAQDAVDDTEAAPWKTLRGHR